MPSSTEYFSFIPTIIAGQFLSYFQAVVKQVEILKNLISNMENETERMLQSIKLKVQLMRVIIKVIPSGNLNY